MTSTQPHPSNPVTSWRMPVFFSNKMVAPASGGSPSAAKPSQVVNSWLRGGLPIEVIGPSPVTIEELSLAHDPGHVRAVLGGRKRNGFGNTMPEVARSLPYTTGSMLSAARHVLRTGGAACAPCSGFHHAGYAFCQGYCTFNGLAVTALALRQAGLARKVGILDCDMHEGDGTDAILRRSACEEIEHWTAGKCFDDPSEVPLFFRWLEDALDAMAGCSVVLYQAGADPHVNDPLGGWLTTPGHGESVRAELLRCYAPITTRNSRKIQENRGPWRWHENSKRGRQNGQASPPQGDPP
jgi:acetoin utilization deacetylase AcuC-like enzyme